MATDYVTYTITSTTTSSWIYRGSASYVIHHNCIEVDKGEPDKAQFVIFYALIDDVDPMIFCKNQKELDREMTKLMKRSDVDQKSIRVFSLAGGVK